MVAIPSWKLNGTVEIISQGVKLEKGEIYSITFSASRMCAQLESLNVFVPPASKTIELQTLYSVQGWDTYASAFQADQDDASVVFTNPDNAVLNGDFEEGPWKFRNASLGVLLPTNLDEETSSLSGWIDEFNRAISHARDMCKQPLAVMAFAGEQAENAEKTRVAFYSVYYNTRSDDMSSLCGPIVDDIMVVVSAGGTEESRVEPIKEEEEKAAEVVATTETKILYRVDGGDFVENCVEFCELLSDPDTKRKTRDPLGYYSRSWDAYGDKEA
ncbi:carbohydrate binding domain-containing protein precursor [Tanacetum coccineum]